MVNYFSLAQLLSTVPPCVYCSLKIQTDDLESIVATSADNIEMNVTSTMNWKITDVVTAATNAAETMATSGRAGDVSADITKLRGDVRKQAIASLAGFIGTVNFSATFHMSADNQRKNAASTQSAVPADAVAGGMDGNEAKADIPEATLGVDNPMFDSAKMYSAVEHANAVTRTCEYMIWIGVLFLRLRSLLFLSSYRWCRSHEHQHHQRNPCRHDSHSCACIRCRCERRGTDG